MSLCLFFWLVMLVALLFGGVKKVSEKAPAWTGNLILWILLVALGWAVFGPPIQ